MSTGTAAPRKRGDRSAVPLPPADCGWLVYILECRDGTLYTGVTNDLPNRYQAHMAGKGARYTRSHPPRRIAAWGLQPDRSSACKLEWAVKQLSRGAKVQGLCASSEVNSHG